ncbi:MAG: DUF4097 family beta strand repeat-containing protein [Candidatus Electryoneaceae bacterium]|nr:DUF4097 family beta strand repeat-containing protein [Candidatus Electryoneaceae bacterium]
MKNLFSPLALLLILSPMLVLAGDYNNAASVQNDFHQEISAENIQNFGIETVNGSIFISGYDGNTITVDAQLMIRGPKEDVCQGLLERTEVIIEDDNGTLSITVKTKKRKKYTLTATFNIQVPNEMNIHTESANGSITLDHISGTIEIETVNGSINGNYLGGDIDASTINGSINLSDLSGNVDAGTINGGIVCQFLTPTPSHLDLGTINGNIRLELQDSPDVELEAQTINGRINISGVPEALSTSDSRHRRRSFEATLGDGSGSYELNTINGSINITVSDVR